jgi:hypothetical protein
MNQLSHELISELGIRELDFRSGRLAYSLDIVKCCLHPSYLKQRYTNLTAIISLCGCRLWGASCAALSLWLYQLLVQSNIEKSFQLRKNKWTAYIVKIAEPTREMCPEQRTWPGSNRPARTDCSAAARTSKPRHPHLRTAPSSPPAPSARTPHSQTASQNQGSISTTRK